ncbi:AAA ATPase domain-containing protein, partial [Streptomyces sp. DvalAA-14]|uniref:AAA family ATPase n=1 Tax=unclassified Streptomyces TaxID=2593676 RepID=UPI00081BA2D9
MVDRRAAEPRRAAPGRPAPAPLRGRAAELGGVLDALRSARQGQPTLVVVSGEPGIGKTALTHVVAEQAQRGGFAVSRSTAYAADRVTPLASLGPGLRSGTDPLITSADFMGLAELHGQPLWLVERLATLLERRAERHPLLLMVDDAQWVDPLTAFALRLLPGRLAASPVVWLLASREAHGGPADQIAEAAGRDVPVVRVGLTALTEDAVLAMAVDRLGPRPDPDVLRRLGRTGGNPFLAAQLLDGLLAPDAADGTGPSLPTGLVEGVRRRMAGGSKECRDLVRAAAVLGPRCALTDIAHLLGSGPGSLTDPLTESIQAGLISDDGDGLRFRHELLREAVYEDIPPSGRRAWHRAITVHFLASGRGPAAVAPHVLATAEPGDNTAVDLLREAAHEVVATMATTSAVFIRHAFDLTAANDPRRPQIGAEVVDVLVTARQYTEAAAFADELLPLATDPDQVAAVQLALMPRLWAAERFAELAARAGDARAVGAAAGPTARLSAYQALAGTSAAAADAAVDAAHRSGDATA